MTKLQLVLTGTGVAAETATKMVDALTARGVDAGAMFNVSDAESLQKIVSGLTGETEPLKAFGVVISQAAVEAELLRLVSRATLRRLTRLRSPSRGLTSSSRSLGCRKGEQLRKRSQPQVRPARRRRSSTRRRGRSGKNFSLP